jgi:hypothetical protein
MSIYSIKDRYQAIKVCDALAVTPESHLFSTCTPQVSDLICLVLVSLSIQKMPPTAEQWRAASAKLQAGWEPEATDQ